MWSAQQSTLPTTDHIETIYHHNYWYISVIILNEFWVREGDNRVPQRMGQRGGYPSACRQVLGIAPGGFLFWQIVEPLGRSNWTCCGLYSLWEQGTLMWVSVYHSPESPPSEFLGSVALDTAKNLGRVATKALGRTRYCGQPYSCMTRSPLGRKG